MFGCCNSFNLCMMYEYDKYEMSDFIVDYAELRVRCVVVVVVVHCCFCFCKEVVPAEEHKCVEAAWLDSAQ